MKILIKKKKLNKTLHKINSLCEKYCYKYEYLSFRKNDNIELTLQFTNKFNHNVIMNQYNNLCQDILRFF